MRAEAAELAQAAPVFGPQMSYGGIGCAKWPFPSTARARADRGDGLAPTSSSSARPTTRRRRTSGRRTSPSELENGHLVTYTGEGHTAYNKSNSCVNDAVDDYFVDGNGAGDRPAVLTLVP